MVLLGISTMQIHRSFVNASSAIEAGPQPDSVPMPGLVPLRHMAEAFGFVAVHEGLVRFGDYQLLVMVHGDGTRTELIERPDLDAGFAFATEFTDGTRVASVPWVQGSEKDRIRMPGATFDELLARHREAVADRCRDGATVDPATPATALAIALESDKVEMRSVMERPWRSAFVSAFQQLVPGVRNSA